MTRPTNFLGMVLLLVSPAVVAAQQSAGSPGGGPIAGRTGKTPTDPLGGGQKASGRATTGEMSEDIEIMRRLLIRDLHPYQEGLCSRCHGGSPSPTASSSGGMTWLQLTLSGFADNVHHIPQLDVDGTYLKDYGVVFHVTMPTPFPVTTTTAKPAGSSLSDWDRVRKELHGEKPAKTAVPAQSAVRGVDDVVLRCLAENGRHFSKLGDKENLTVIVAFRPFTDRHAVWLHSYIDPSTQAATRPSQPKRTTAAVPLTWPGTTSLDISSGGSDFELLGDLQLKQGRVQEAIQAYRKALEMQPARSASVYQKLAQAHLKIDEKGATDGAIVKAIEFLRRAQESAKNGRTTTAGGNLPSATVTKLVVTAPKSLLDAAAKTISYEEFRRAAHVERFTAPTSQGQGTSTLDTGKVSGQAH